MSFKYLDNDRNLYKDLKEQIIKSSKISGNLRDVAWRKPFMTIKSKMKIYKITVKHVVTYGA